LLDPQFGVFEIINTVLACDDLAMIEQIFWLIGNISGENNQLRDLIINNTMIIDTFKRLLEKSKISRFLLRTLCWVNSNIYRYKGFLIRDVPVGL
jgi:hypothetical protein